MKKKSILTVLVFLLFVAVGVSFLVPYWQVAVDKIAGFLEGGSVNCRVMDKLDGVKTMVALIDKDKETLTAMGLMANYVSVVGFGLLACWLVLALGTGRGSLRLAKIVIAVLGLVATVVLVVGMIGFVASGSAENAFGSVKTLPGIGFYLALAGLGFGSVFALIDSLAKAKK